MKRADACLIIYNSKGQALLQVRDDLPGIDYPNKIGLFGGRIEPGETALEAVKREISEELNGYVLSGPKLLGIFDVGVGYKAHIFVKHEPALKAQDYVVTEGKSALFVDEKDIGRLDIVDIVVPLLKEFFEYIKKVNLEV
jgi:8-oxo-dGTP pyrophosphatase MutT (NUDIX family)